MLQNTFDDQKIDWYIFDIENNEVNKVKED